MLQMGNQSSSDLLSQLWETYSPLLFNLVLVLLIVFFLWIFWGFLLRRIKTRVSPELHNALRTLGRATFLLLGLFWIVGEELFFGAAALLGTAIGFASSTTIGNFISGLYLLVTNPFNVGDYVMIPSFKAEGIVEEISINYTKILTPQGIHVIISNQKLLGASIFNTNITIPSEAIDKGKITWRDHKADRFDSIEDVVDILKGIRARYALKSKEYYIYPLNFSVNPDKYIHSRTEKVMELTTKKFSERTEEPINWFLLDRSTYQLNLIVSNPYAIFDLRSDILGYLESELEKAHSL
ncbi:MAG: mechanosensitive ion channel domain-containing protein [Candidatus Heimdallarchaeota archaeon]